MNKFKFYFILLITTVTIFSCEKDDDNNNYTPEPLRDYQTQYNAEIIVIEKYLNSNYIDLSDPNFADKDVIIKKITDPAAQPSLMSYLNASTFPTLKSKNVEMDGVTYKLYYLVLREGIGEKPCNVDGVFTPYTGSYLYETPATATASSEISTTEFEKVVNPSIYLSLFTTIAGWGETFPEFKTGTYDFTTSGNGTITYKDFGAGVMFLPSGLAYYNNGSASIPAYSPLIFSFKLYQIQRLDQDGDGIPSYLEDINGDGYVRLSKIINGIVTYPDDTDKDGIPDFYDIDDDGDNYTTRLETQYIHPDDPNKTKRYYPFNGVSNNDPNNPDDNPATPYVDESKGIPAYTPAGLDYKTPTRIRIHLDKDHH